MRIIFITGGVVSSLGKGVVASIIGGLFDIYNLKIKIKKIDPYLNIDPGTLNPIEHGEVFVTGDGVETDLDLGHYERLANIKTSKNDYITSGLVYQNILNNEREGVYKGKTVQIIPHFTNELQRLILQGAENCDILICEIGGTIGDIESAAILEAVRQMKVNKNYQVMNIHVALLPYLKKAQEWKTKPIQHSVRELLTFGIQADLLLCRMEEKNPENWKSKLSQFCNIREENILEALDAKTIYHAMQNYYKEGIVERISEYFKLNLILNKETEKLNDFIKKLDADLKVVNLALIGKYIENKDSYKSIEESLLHAGAFNDVKVKISFIDSENLNVEDLKRYDCIVVAGGFGERAVNGKKAALRYAYHNNIPVLGICFGMQLMIIDALIENYPEMKGISSSEFGECENPVIAKLNEWNNEDKIQILKEQLGGSMRLGLYKCDIVNNSLAQKIYQQNSVYERHRHRYEVNNEYLKYFEKADLYVSGTCNGLVEIVERRNSKFCIAVQFHPEFESNYLRPHPLFISLIKACLN